MSRCAVLARNRLGFRALEDELKATELPYYKSVPAAAYQSESDVLKEFELALRLLQQTRGTVSI